MPPVMELVSISKNFGRVSAVTDVSLSIERGEVICLLGDNGAGKSTLIKIMSGVHKPSAGEVRIDGASVQLDSPRAAQRLGIATVHQDIGIFPLMSVSRNFFVGREPEKGWGPFRRIDRRSAGKVALEQLRSLGIRRVTNSDQLVGTLSGGERQALAIGRAVYFGARLLILDEPTSALGVKEAGVVLRLVQEAKGRGIAIMFITHNANHALTVGDRFTVLIHGAAVAQFARGERSREEILNLMAGGEELQTLQAEMEELNAAEVLTKTGGLG
jgi:simple sugar transport system ATP-binding protein